MFSTAITARICASDGSGHINNTVAPVWFEAQQPQPIASLLRSALHEHLYQSALAKGV